MFPIPTKAVVNSGLLVRRLSGVSPAKKRKMGSGPFSVRSSSAKATGTNPTGPLECDGQKKAHQTLSGETFCPALHGRQDFLHQQLPRFSNLWNAYRFFAFTLTNVNVRTLCCGSKCFL